MPSVRSSPLAAGDITDSVAFTVAGWTRNLPLEMRTETDQILLQAAAAGAPLDDLAVIAGRAIERWRCSTPTPDEAGDGFDDRSVQLGITSGGATVLRGDLTPECAAAVRAVLGPLGKKARPAAPSSGRPVSWRICRTDARAASSTCLL